MLPCFAKDAIAFANPRCQPIRFGTPSIAPKLNPGVIGPARIAGTYQELLDGQLATSRKLIVRSCNNARNSLLTGSFDSFRSLALPPYPAVGWFRFFVT